MEMGNGPYLLGIDIGGTGSKAGVFSLDGKLKGEGYGEYSMISTLPGQAEHDAEGWWQATIMAVRKAIEGVPAEEILAIGIGCTNGLIAVDREGKPLRSAIISMICNTYCIAWPLKKYWLCASLKSPLKTSLAAWCIFF